MIKSLIYPLSHIQKDSRTSVPETTNPSMAAILLSFAEGISSKLGQLAIPHIQYVFCLKSETRKFMNTLSTIRAALADLEGQQQMSYAETDWLEKIRDVLYDADDLVDDFATEALRKQLVTPSDLVEKVLHFFSTIGFYIAMAYQLKDIRDRLDDMAADRSKFHPVGQGIDLLVRKKEREQTYSYVFEPNVVGRDGDKKAIKEMIMESRNEEDVLVVPITGIGGIGKTTLAQLVYNDEEVEQHFQLKMWVCVSNNFDTEPIVRKMIESATHRKCENFELEVLQTLLRKEIAGKRYLLVLDDMWSENCERWQKFRELLLGGGRGSRIVVTTRMEVVATIVGTVGLTYELKRLPEDLSWSLFRQMAFKSGHEDPRLLAIGQEIVGKCVGNPLAIRAAGSLLYSQHTENEWAAFKRYKSPGTPRNGNVDALEILKFSYDHLPSHLKPCFAYCSLFPKDSTMDKDTLIKLWIAQGFVQSPDGYQCLEDAGHEYFTQLCRRSFFQDVKDEYSGETPCNMNDLFHDLAKSVAGTDISVADLDPPNFVQKSRHVSFSSPLDSSWEVPTCLLNTSKIRTFLLPVQPKASPQYRISFSACEIIFLRFPRVRVLDLHNLWLPELPSSIGDLRRLRYLDLRYNRRLTSLPRSITKLQNLQTLRLSCCENLQELPSNISKLASLQHLEIDGCTTLTHMPLGLGQLTSLQTLTRFIVGWEDISCSGLSELNSLVNLRGRLAVEGLGRSKRATKEAAGCLKGKEYLRWLVLNWGYQVDGDDDDEDDDKLLLEGLQPHQNLKKLEIYGYNGSSFPGWMRVNIIGLSLPNLVELEIKSCNTCRHLPPLRQLPSLQVLHLKFMASLEYVEGDYYSVDDSNDNSHSFPSPSTEVSGRGGSTIAFFPSLKELCLESLPKLKGWWKTSEVFVLSPEQMLMPSFACLSKSTIRYCPKLRFMPALPSAEQLELVGISRKVMKMMLLTSVEKPMSSMSLTATISSALSSSNLLPLSKLKYLRISRSEDLVSLPRCIGNLTSLQELDIFDCPN